LEYQNGDDIPTNVDYALWWDTFNSEIGASAVYGEGWFEESNGYCESSVTYFDACNPDSSLAEFGRLYNWYAVTDERNICPEGWHVPVYEEWATLDSVLYEFFPLQGSDALRSNTGWNWQSTGSDAFGFSALPAGSRGGGGIYDYSGSIGYVGAGTDATWWSASEVSYNLASAYGIAESSEDPVVIIDSQEVGYSVRCIRDSIFYGCTDPTFMEFDPQANWEDGTCSTTIIEGCMDSLFLEFDAEVNVDDGSCETLIIEGCMDSLFMEYNYMANVDDGSCFELIPPCESPMYDGYLYSVVQIGFQCWFAENLRTPIYSNGDSLGSQATVYGFGEAPCDDASASFEACNDSLSLGIYGRMYNGTAVLDPRGLCPTGWRVPSDADWDMLEQYIETQGLKNFEGYALKADNGWHNGGNGIDAFGFGGLPGGQRNNLGEFEYAGQYGYFWSVTPYNFYSNWVRSLSYSSDGIGRFTRYTNWRLSVRCIAGED
jgi:uncharacterized protein (TIGR02145 family)